MVFIYRKHPFTQGDTKEKSDAKLSRDELASAFSLQASSIRIKRPDGVAAVIENAQDDIIYTVHGSPAGQGELTVFEDLGQSVYLDMLWAASSFSSLLSQLFLPVSTMYYKARMGFNTGITYLPLLHLLSNKFSSSTRSGTQAVKATGLVHKTGRTKKKN
ncbi:hypothetical protein PROFUN_15961 [Planoprotostelium fungivorum]|uniref:Uncharacterized protein n=1 Tax=Planoprotostelium fungivorum TaxID=1890364 RepID=A0A2P6MU12_9EUKA|nr:hypothetical protein PROFUN_15961 [Planoprotostelium fungivorum]